MAAESYREAVNTFPVASNGYDQHYLRIGSSARRRDRTSDGQIRAASGLVSAVPTYAGRPREGGDTDYLSRHEAGALVVLTSVVMPVRVEVRAANTVLMLRTLSSRVVSTVGP